MGQIKDVPHSHRRDEPRTRIRDALPLPRRETILRAIEATLRELADTQPQARRAGQRRLAELRRLADMR